MNLLIDLIILGVMKIFTKSRATPVTKAEGMENWIILDNLGNNSAFPDIEKSNLPDFDSMPEFHDGPGWE